MTRSRTHPNGLTTTGTPIACASATARPNVSTEPVERPIREGRTAAGKPARDRRGMVGPGDHQSREIRREPPEITWFLQIIGGIVQPKQPPPGVMDKADDPMAAIADIKIPGSGDFARQRRPTDPLVTERGRQADPHPRPLAAAPQRLRNPHTHVLRRA